MCPFPNFDSLKHKSIFRRSDRILKHKSVKISKSRTSQPSCNDSKHHPKQPNNASSNSIQSQYLHQAILDDEPCGMTSVGSENSGKFYAGITATEPTTLMSEPEGPKLEFQSCILFTIPLEIRRLILEFALPYATEDAQFGYVWTLGSTSILQTCHQLYHEGTHVMYDANPLNCILDIDSHEILFCARYLQPSSNPFPKYEDHVDISFNHCRDLTNWTRIYERKVSSETLGWRNVALMRHWVLEIMGCNDLVGEMRFGTSDMVELTDKIRLLVEETVIGLLLRAEKLSKVMVQWKGTAPDMYTNRLENQKRILEPLRLLGVEVEEDLSFLEAWK